MYVEHGGAGDDWRVELRTGARCIVHTVTVPEAAARDLGYLPAEIETLLRASFVFLLEREPQSSILPSFAIHEITRYFREYPDAIGRAR